MTGRCLSLCVALLGLPGSAATQAQQTCNLAGKALSSPNSRYMDAGDGAVTDRNTQLMWMRCAAGQVWAASVCTGAATRHDWQAGQAVASEINRTGTHFFNDWRMPTLRELASVAELHCSHPRINLAMFPATPSAPFWTSSARVAREQAEAYVLDFDVGAVAAAGKEASHHLRLVRNAP